MVQLFPKLKKYPFLLAFYWLVRDFRYYRTIWSRRLNEMILKAKRKWLEIKEKFKKEEEISDEEGAGEEILKQEIAEEEILEELAEEEIVAEEKFTEE